MVPTFQELLSYQVAYRFLWESFNAKLEAYCLLHSYELPLEVSVSTLIEHVAQDMECSSFHYQFSLIMRGTASFSPEEMLPLQLLEVVNRGVPCQTDGQIRLQCAAHSNLMIGDLAANQMHYAVPSITIEGNQFIIHLGNSYILLELNCTYKTYIVVRTYPVTALTSLDPSLPARLHSCISRKLFFHFEVDAVCSEANDEEEPSSDEDETPVPNLDQPRHSERLAQLAHGNTSSSHPLVGEPRPGQDSGSNTATAPLQRGLSISSLYSLLALIWQSQWVPSVGRHARLFSLDSLTACVYEVATSGEPPETLDLRGPNIRTIASIFKGLLGDTIDNNDFTKILSPVRSFLM